MVDFAMEFKYPVPPKSLYKAIGIAVCIHPNPREFPTTAKNLIVDFLQSVVQQHMKEARSEEVREAILKLFNDLIKESPSEPF